MGSGKDSLQRATLGACPRLYVVLLFGFNVFCVTINHQFVKYSHSLLLERHFQVIDWKASIALNPLGPRMVSHSVAISAQSHSNRCTNTSPACACAHATRPISVAKTISFSFVTRLFYWIVSLLITIHCDYVSMDGTEVLSTTSAIPGWIPVSPWRE